MNAQYKANMDVKVVESSSWRVRSCCIMLRLLGVLLTLIATILTGVDKETKIVSITITKTLPPLHLPLTAKWQYMSANVFFLVANAIACVYAAASLVVYIAAKRFKTNAALVLNILDILITGLLLSANGAAIAVGLIGVNGNSHANWNKVCNMFDEFCRRLTIAIVLSMIGSSVFLWLVVLTVYTLHRKLS
ncbi:DUF588 domain-containing protein [Cephalotus follicularis]|uniref:CASP-like protein n=1 Tax=Cephalotus follicularis TaxID=3775 RepID=A0A1Q3CTC4_CEPFO|nr:DUF588 domain-containing protein [Cephalotus follicularis]